MPFTVACPFCSHESTIPDHFVGHHVRCPKCKQKFQVTGPPPEPAGAPEPLALPEGNIEPDQVADRRPASRWAAFPLRKLVVYGGAGTFGLMLADVVLWSLAAGFTGSWFGTLLVVLAGLVTVVNFALSIAVFLVSLKFLFEVREWVGAAALTASCLAFLVSCSLGMVLLVTLSTAIMGARVWEKLSHPGSRPFDQRPFPD